MTITLQDYRDFLLSRDDSNRHRGLCHQFAEFAMRAKVPDGYRAALDFMGDRFHALGMDRNHPFHDAIASFFHDMGNKVIVRDREAFAQSEIDWLNKVLEGTGCTQRPVNE